MKIIKWTFWGDPRYTEFDWTKEAEKAYELTIIEAIRKYGYRFSGQAHQHAQYGVPVFDNGQQYNVSMRHWGRIMADALGIEGKYAYTDWAWYPAESTMVFPDPSQWNEGPKEIAEQKERWLNHEKDWLIQECGGSEKIGWQQLKEEVD